jgi:acetyl-CoA carboxylase biotin carboxyl carrier protein
MAASNIDVQQEQRVTATTDILIGHVRELIGLMSKGGISELDLSTGDVSIRLRGQSASVQTVVTQTSHQAAPQEILPAEPEGYLITAPMIGTFYSAPAPGEAPFVQIGDEIEVGQVIGIIEAMKIMNEIIADRAGVVVEVMATNADAVEYGSPLVRLSNQTDLLA